MASIAGNAWENFLEIIAGITAKALTDKETEAVINSFTRFQEKLKRLSSRSLHRLALEFEPVQAKTLCSHEGKTCTQNCVRGFIRAFLTSFAIKYLLAVAPEIVTGRVFKRPRVLRDMAGRDTLSFAMFLSTFIGSYKGILCMLRNYRQVGDKKSDHLNAFIAGSIAGLSLILERNKHRRLAIMLYLFTRSCQFGCAFLMKKWAEIRKHRRRNLIQKLKEEVDMRELKEGEKREIVVQPGWDDVLAKFLQDYAGTMVMMLANAQIIYALIFEAQTLGKSYYGFLLSHGGWGGDFKEMAVPLMNSLSTTINSLSKTGADTQIPLGTTSREYIATHVSPNIAQLIPPGIRHKHIVCALQHPLEASCWRAKRRDFFMEFARAMKLYLPLNAIMTLVFRYNKVTSDPLDVIFRTGKSTIRSSLFLTMYVVVGMATVCALRPLGERHLNYVVGGAVGGAMVLLESKGRHLELGLYCMPRALESWWKCMVKWGYVNNVPGGDVALFSVAMGVMMLVYQTDPTVISKHYLSVLTRFFGRN